MNSPLELIGSAVGEASSGEWQVITKEIPRSQPTVVGYIFTDGERDFAVITRDGVAVRTTDCFFVEYEAAKSTFWRLLYQEVDGQPPPPLPRKTTAEDVTMLQMPDGRMVEQGSPADRATWWTCVKCDFTGPAVGTNVAGQHVCMGIICGGVQENPNVPRSPGCKFPDEKARAMGDSP